MAQGKRNTTSATRSRFNSSRSGNDRRGLSVVGVMDHATLDSLGTLAVNVVGVIVSVQRTCKLLDILPSKEWIL